MDHFIIKYAKSINEMLHTYLISTWHYKHQIYEIPGLLTALLITYDDQEDDEYEIIRNISWDDFLKRMSEVKPDWISFDKEIIEKFVEQPHKTMGGWEGRTIYVIRGGSNQEFWTEEKAKEDVTMMIAASAMIQGPYLLEEIKHIDKLIPVGHEYYRDYEDFVRICVNYLFNDHLGEAKAQARTEPGNEGTEIRDLLAPNKAKEGFFHDIKMKYECSEIIIEVKNKSEITRDDLRQLYCYLKPTIGLWGFIFCRSRQPKKIHSYNRALHKNFIQNRGILILTDDDLQKMLKMKIRERDPSEYLQDIYSKFIRSV